MHGSSHMVIRSRWVALLLGGAVLLAAVLVSGAAAGSSSNGPPQLRVYGGGNVGPGHCTDGPTPFCSDAKREFSLLAIHDPNENVTYGTLSGANSTVVRVTCIAVSGNVAEVAGVILQMPDSSFVGGPFWSFVRDSGPTGADPRDGISPAFFDYPSAGKATCSRSDAASDAFGVGFFPLTNGDIAIQNLINQNG
jgi:hypothetical protein